MTPARHFRTLEPIRAADGRVGTIKAHAVQPADLLICVMGDGTRRDIPAGTVTWSPIDRCWVEAR